MGLHIIVYDGKHERHPGWDSLRQKNDSEFRWMILAQEVMSIHDTGDGWTIGFRPVDIELLRRRILASEFDNTERYLGLCDILEADQGAHIHFSI